MITSFNACVQSSTFRLSIILLIMLLKIIGDRLVHSTHVALGYKSRERNLIHKKLNRESNARLVAADIRQSFSSDALVG
jgi:hypothetical protein